MSVTCLPRKRKRRQRAKIDEGYNKGDVGSAAGYNDGAERR